LLGITAVLITCSFRGKEFIRVGYYINNTYTEELLIENPPNPPMLDKVTRYLLADKPRITKFPIEWESHMEMIQTYNGGFIHANEAYQQMYNQDRSEMLDKKTIEQVTNS